MLNIVLLVLAFLLFARLQFRFELKSFLFAPARERVMSVSRLAALQLPDTPRSEWSKLLNRYAAQYPAQFYLFNDDGVQLAGKPVKLPATVFQQVRNSRFRHGPEGTHHPPPPPDDHGVTGSGFGGQPEGPPPNQGHGPPPHDGNERAGPPAGLPHLGLTDAPVSFLKTSNPTEYWAEVGIPLWIPDRADPIHGVLVWQMHSLWTEPFFFDYRPWLAISVFVIFISALCWVPLVRGLTQSVSRVTEATMRIAGGHFDIKLPATRRDELGQLSESINRMAERLSGHVYGQKRFLGDVAHELSSPLARMQVALSILERRIAEEQSCAYVADVQEEVEHMSTLVGELLSFSKAQIAAMNAEIRRVNLEETIDRVLAREASEQSNISIHIDKGLEVLAAPEYLFRALANIVRNAIRYAGSAGPIEISASALHGQVEVKVADSGPGISEGELEDVFRPFYRPEFARQRETGGTGLGLAIVRDCVESCGGRVVCRNRAPHGLEVVIELADASQHGGRNSGLFKHEAG